MTHEVIEREAEIVQTVYRFYTHEGLSINAIARWLNGHQVPTCKGMSPWERTTVWAMLRNPAYRGMACFGKTERVPRRKVNRSLRRQGGYSPRCGAHRERPREEWLEIPVPALVSEESFALAQEQLENNKRYAARRTIEPTLLQGLLACHECGYAYYRTSTRTSSRKLYASSVEFMGQDLPIRSWIGDKTNFFINLVVDPFSSRTPTATHTQSGHHVWAPRCKTGRSLTQGRIPFPSLPRWKCQRLHLAGGKRDAAQDYPESRSKTQVVPLWQGAMVRNRQ